MMRQRHIYMHSYVLIRLLEHPALMEVAPRNYKSTIQMERSASEHNSGAQNTGMQELHTKLTNSPIIDVEQSRWSSSSAELLED
jgi:hypothetical protein